MPLGEEGGPQPLDDKGGPLPLDEEGNPIAIGRGGWPNGQMRMGIMISSHHCIIISLQMKRFLLKMKGILIIPIENEIIY